MNGHSQSHKSAYHGWRVGMGSGLESELGEKCCGSVLKACYRVNLT